VERKIQIKGYSVPRRVEILKAIANPTRLAIVLSLSQGDATVSALAEALGFKPCIISQQLGILRSNDIVRGVREGGFIRYELVDPLVQRLIRVLDGGTIIAGRNEER
jgi:DNA-binding transcriptional ArsR family regulator